MIVVSDTSPISALLIIGEVELLHKVFGDVIIPVAVYTELLRTFPTIPDWIRVAGVKDATRVEAFHTLVDAGEAEAIQLAKEIHADRILIDDNKGRKLAESEGLHAIGLIGVLVLAKTGNLIPSVRNVISRLKSESHIYLSEDVIAVALRAAGE
jgi:predicted nucleic acid-binding protein